MSRLSGSTVVSAIPPQSASAGATNGAWLDCRQYAGPLCFNLQVGAVTGNVTYKLQDATDSGGSGSADITGATTGALSAANTATDLKWPSENHRGFIRVVATVVTGPILIGASLRGHPKYTS